MSDLSNHRPNDGPARRLSPYQQAVSGGAPEVGDAVPPPPVPEPLAVPQPPAVPDPPAYAQDAAATQVVPGLPSVPEPPAVPDPPAAPEPPAYTPDSSAAPTQVIPDPAPEWQDAASATAATTAFAAGPPLPPVPDDTAVLFPSTSAPEAPAAAPKTKKRRIWLRWVIAVGILAILGVGGFIAHRILSETIYGPHHEVEAYLDAVVAGDAEKAVSLFSPKGAEDDGLLLTNTIYQAAEGRPTGYEIVETEIDGDDARVIAEIEIGDEEYRTTFDLSPSGTTLLVFKEWEIEDGPEQSIEVGSIGTTTTVNGIETDFSEISAAYADSENFQELPVLPGVYVFTAPTSDSEYFAYGGDQSVTVLPGARRAQDDSVSVVSFHRQLTENARDAAIAAVEKRISTCMTSDAFEPTGCEAVLSMYDPGTYAVTSITRSWDEEPYIEFINGDEDYSYDEVASGEYAVHIDGGDMHIDYKYRYTEEDEWRESEDDFYEVFSRGDNYDYNGTFVMVTFDESGMSLDFSEFED